MARCKLTRMSLRNIRKDKQYQCIVIDFVRTGVISKSKAEELLNYTIPAGLLEGSVAAPDDDEDEPGTGGSGTEGSGTEGSGTGGNETEDTITLNLLGAFMYDGSGLTLDEYTDYDPSGNTPVQVQVPAALVTSLNTKFADSDSVSVSDTDLVSFINILKTAVDAAAAECGANDSSSQIYDARMCTLDGSDFYLAKADGEPEGSPTSWSIGNIYYYYDYDGRVVRNNGSTGTGEIKDGDTYFVSIKYADGE